LGLFKVLRLWGIHFNRVWPVGRGSLGFKVFAPFLLNFGGVATGILGEHAHILDQAHFASIVKLGLMVGAGIPHHYVTRIDSDDSFGFLDSFDIDESPLSLWIVVFNNQMGALYILQSISIHRQ
jgi:hypothetical protein